MICSHVLQSRKTCAAQIFANLEDIKSHWSVYCIEFSLVDDAGFLATEAIVLSLYLDPINNQSIDVHSLTSVKADILPNRSV